MQRSVTTRRTLYSPQVHLRPQSLSTGAATQHLSACAAQPTSLLASATAFENLSASATKPDISLRRCSPTTLASFSADPTLAKSFASPMSQALSRALHRHAQNFSATSSKLRSITPWRVSKPSTQIINLSNRGTEELGVQNERSNGDLLNLYPT
jgi:hypothetical protein